MPVLEAQALYKSFAARSAPVLDGLSFSIGAGETYGLLGPNGSGKTTAINIICHLLQPDGGTVRLGGEPVSASAKARIGVAAQEIALYEHLTCAENLAFFAALYGLRGREQRTRVAECLAAVALA